MTVLDVLAMRHNTAFSSDPNTVHIIPMKTHNPVATHHADLFANCLSQSRAMMAGKSLEEALAELAAEGRTEA